MSKLGQKIITNYMDTFCQMKITFWAPVNSLWRQITGSNYTNYFQTKKPKASGHFKISGKHLTVI